MDTVYELKKQVRRDILRLKSSHSNHDLFAKSNLIFNRIESLDIFKNSDTVLVFWSIQGEVNTHDFILRWYKLKQIILPVITGDELELKLFTGKENMVTGFGMGIPEPVGEKFPFHIAIDLSIIPGVAFDMNKNRLGWGKGYYDRLLPKINTYTVGICFDFQLFDSIPVSDTDIKMDMVIWNTGKLV